jgi:hypothetical protein
LAPYQEPVVNERSGSVAIAGAANRFVVDSVINGLDVYELDSGRWMANFNTGKPPIQYPNGVAFADRLNAVVCGSDHGAVYVFDMQSGARKKVLRHGGEGVQTVTVRDMFQGTSIILTVLQTHDTNDASIIVSASTSTPGKRSICVWKRKLTVVTPTRARRSGSEEFVRFVMLVIIVAFMYQNVGMNVSFFFSPIQYFHQRAQLQEQLPRWKTSTKEVWNIFRNPDVITAEHIRATIREINERMQGTQREAAEEFYMDELERKMKRHWERSERETREQEMLARERWEEVRQERDRRLAEAEKKVGEMWERQCHYVPWREGEDGDGQCREGQDPQGQVNETRDGN